MSFELHHRKHIEDELTKIVRQQLRNTAHALTTTEYAEDCPSELAGQAVDIWRRRRRNCALPLTFIEKFTPDWDWLAR